MESNKLILYQVFTRLYGNRNTTRKENGTIAEKSRKYLIYNNFIIHQYHVRLRSYRYDRSYRAKPYLGHTLQIRQHQQQSYSVH